MDVTGKVAIVTGAAAETGRAVALRLGTEGAAVVVADVDVSAGEETVRMIEGRGGSAVFVITDVTDVEQVERMVSSAQRSFGGVDILINNAGGTPEPHFPEAAPAHWGATLDLNLRAPMLATQAAIEAMRPRGGGVVVNIASTAGLGYGAYVSPEYGAAKAGLIRFTTSLSDLGDEIGVRVNCLVPDWIGTERAGHELAAMSAVERASVAPPIPMDDVVDAVLRLIADESLAGRVLVLRPGEGGYLIEADRRE
jgi:NAD(P)-dependent dehydrogenase (short-subunit alcohol dehydrogenase family)